MARQTSFDAQMIEVCVDPPVSSRTHCDSIITDISGYKEMVYPSMTTDEIARLVRHASRLDYDATFTASAVAIALLSLAGLQCAEFVGRARARRHTARSIAQVEREQHAPNPDEEALAQRSENKLHKTQS